MREQKDCKEPCLKNGRSDRFCLKCANEIMEPVLPTKSNNEMSAEEIDSELQDILDQFSENISEDGIDAYSWAKNRILGVMDTHAQSLLSKKLKEQDKEMIKKLNPVLEKLHSRQYKDASRHLGTIIYCLENPSVDHPL